MLLGYAKYTIGRARDAEIILQHDTISGRHAMLVALPDGRCELIDLRSGNGVCIKQGNDFVRVEHSEPLSPSNVVRIGDYETTIGALVEMQKRRADIFISYSRADRDKAKALAVNLAEHGWQIWWDDRLQLAKSFDEVIEEQIRQARCVVVLWSGTSIASQWVRAEAGVALDKGNLVSLFIENVEAPLLFRQIHGYFLTTWDGDKPIGTDDLHLRLAQMIGEPGGKPSLSVDGASSSPAPKASPQPPGPKGAGLWSRLFGRH